MLQLRRPNSRIIDTIGEISERMKASKYVLKLNSVDLNKYEVNSYKESTNLNKLRLPMQTNFLYLTIRTKNDKILKVTGKKKQAAY